MTPDYERAARKAVETLIAHNVSTSPVDPLPILKHTPGVLTVSFSDMSEEVGMERRNVLTMFGVKNQDAVTFVDKDHGSLQYIVVYNQMLPHYLLQRTLARELGHIILGHDGTVPEEIQTSEAKCFAHHLLCPRPLVHLVRAAGIRFTIEVLGNLTGCYDRCLSCMRYLPAVHVPAELNHQVRENFNPYFMNFFEFQRTIAKSDGTAIADFGSYMDGYEE